MGKQFQTSLSLSRRLLLCCLTSLTVLAAHFWGAFSSLEHLFQDTQTRLLGHSQSPPENIVVIEINDSSFERMQHSVGNWPWPRSIFSAVLQQCEEAKAVAFDIFFFETDQRIRRGDQTLAEEVAAQKNVISALFLNNISLNKEQEEALNPFYLENRKLPAEEAPLYKGALLPFPALLEASAGLGHANYKTDSDGVIRNYLLAANLNQRIVPSLALATAALSSPPLRVDDKALVLADHQIRTDGHRNLRFSPYLKNIEQGYFRSYNIADVLLSWNQEAQGKSPSIARSAFKDKIVLIGSTAQGLQTDRKVTSFDATTPGVYIHATALANLLDGKGLRIPPPLQHTLLIIVLGMLPCLLKIGRSSRAFIAVGLLIAVGYNGVLMAALFLYSYLLPVAAPLTALFFSLFILSILNWNRELSQKRDLQNLESAKQQFTDMLVHDLKGGIATMMMSLDMLERKMKGSDKKNVFLIKSLSSSSSRLNTQVSALLDIRKIEEGRMSLDLQPHTVQNLIEECLTLFKTNSELLNINLEIRNKIDHPLQVTVDRDIFMRMLTNLLWNAFQHGSAGKNIVISSEKSEEGFISISIANQGAPIPPEQQKTLFQPFVALAHAERRNKMVSTGLGLAFCKLAVEAHHGSISLQSPWPESGDGVEFIMKFPANFDPKP